MSTVAVISAGGVVGTLARYGLGVAFPVAPGGFPWTTFVINVTGCLLIGVLMVVITEATRPHPLVRPFLGIGVLGGFTTFSGYVVDIGRTLTAGAPAVAAAYLAGTLLAALAAVHAGAAVTRAAVGRRRKESP
nr:CrcB family protein [Sphaerisporangium rubeum]